MTTSTSNLHVFVSYSPNDTYFAMNLVKRLRDVLGNEEDAVHYEQCGETQDEGIWRKVMTGEVAACDYCITVLSPAYLKSSTGNSVLDIAQSQRKKIIPIVCSPCEDVIFSKRPDIIAIQFIQFYSPYNEEVAFTKVLKVLGISSVDTQGDAFEDPRKAIFAQERIARVEAAFTNHDWLTVIRNIDYLHKILPTAMTPRLLWAKAYALREQEEAQQSEEIFLKVRMLTRDPTERYILLRDSTDLLLSAKMWSDVVGNAREALRLFPGDSYWLSLQQGAQSKEQGTFLTGSEAEEVAGVPKSVDILRILQKFQPNGMMFLSNDKLYVGKDIPYDKLIKARAVCNIPNSERILGLIDCSLFNSAKRCLLFGSKGLYFFNTRSSPEQGMIAYANFPACTFTRRPYHVETNTGVILDISGSTVSTWRLYYILNAIRQLSINASESSGDGNSLALSDTGSIATMIYSNEPVKAPRDAVTYLNWLGAGLALLILLGIPGFLLYKLATIGIVAVNAQLTAINQAYATATATASLVTNNPDPYTPVGGVLVLYDPLKGPANWNDATDLSFGGACRFSGGFYHVSETQSNHLFPCVSQQANFSNFAFEVRMTIIKGDCGGIVFRYSQGYLYSYMVCRDGNYFLQLISPSQEKLLASKPSTAIHKGLNETNVIAVVANGSTLDLYVNNQEVASIQDDSSSSGVTGLSAADTGTPTEVEYSFARAWTY